MSTDTKEPSNPARRALGWSLATGLLGAALAAWMLQRYAQEVSGGEPVAVLRALTPIERGSVLRDDLFTAANVPASYAEARAVRASDLAKVRGVRIANALETQDTLQWSDLAASHEQRDLSALVQPGNRALTVQAAPSHVSAQGARLIRPGDYVDVLANLGSGDSSGLERDAKLVSVLLLQRVLVLAVGTVTDPQLMRAEAGGDELLGPDVAPLTLSLKVEEAQLLALAQERGRLSVMLRQPDDTRIIESAPELAVATLFDSAFRNELQRKRSVERRAQRITSSPVSR